MALDLCVVITEGHLFDTMEADWQEACTHTETSFYQRNLGLLWDFLLLLRLSPEIQSFSNQISLYLSFLPDFASAFQAVWIMSMKMPRNSEEVVFSGGSAISLFVARCVQRLFPCTPLMWLLMVPCVWFPYQSSTFTALMGVPVCSGQPILSSSFTSLLFAWIFPLL